MTEAAPDALEAAPGAASAPPPATAPALSMQDITFRFRDGPEVLRVPEFELAAGERVFLRGASGSGKSTLLGLAAGILSPSEGRVEVMGRPMSEASGPRRDSLRADAMGVIFQLFNLVPYLSPLENVMLPCRFSDARRQRAEDAGGVEREARRLLNKLGLSAELRRARDTTELSVGQQQRVASARALIGSPALILADEPTTALDADAKLDFIRLLAEETAAAGAALLFVSHDSDFAREFPRVEDLATLNDAEAALRKLPDPGARTKATAAASTPKPKPTPTPDPVADPDPDPDPEPWPDGTAKPAAAHPKGTV